MSRAYPVVNTHPLPVVCSLSAVKLGIRGCDDIAGDAKQAAEGVERVEAAIEAKRELVEITNFTAAYNKNATPFVWRKREVKGSQLRNTIVNLVN